jgi:hypothetical protein
VGKRLLAWFILSTIGIAVLAAPDDEDRVVSLSDDHGISSLDTIGVVLLVAGWAFLMTVAWRARARAQARLGALGTGLVLGACVVGVAVLIVTIAGDTGALWMLGVAILAVAQAVFFVAATR